MFVSAPGFILFLTVLVITFHLSPLKLRRPLILIASGLFLGYYSVVFLTYTVLYACANYLIGIQIEKHHKQPLGKQYYLLGIYLNISLLVFFKYIGFLIENLLGIVSVFTSVQEFNGLNLLIPIGISFYTFQNIGYLIDIQRGQVKAERNIIDFLSFVLFFPKLFAGPVERAKNLLPQIKFNNKVDIALVKEGAVQLFWGLAKKMIVADRINLVIQSIQGDLHSFQGMPLIVLFFLQFLHLYLDFSGYTDIVLGIGKFFGVKLLPNFERPLFAQSVGMFWRRWHMSLSHWCDDYIYKKILVKRYRWKKWGAIYAIMMTFLVVGVWHGANWTFVVIGVLQGVAIGYEFLTKRKRIKIGSKLPRKLNVFLSRIITFLFACVTHVIFYAKDLNDVGYFFANMFKGLQLSLQGYGIGVEKFNLVIIAVGIAFVVLIEYLKEKGIAIRATYLKPTWLRWGVYLVLFLLVVIYGMFGSSDFVYANF
ncbi:hypothetical protein OAO55_02555 [Bacteroidales bacterium]|nr:hypothetical protein [Bacteroidales bacterium]